MQNKSCAVLSDPHYRYAVVGRELKNCKTILDVGGYKDCEAWLKKTVRQMKSYASLNVSSAWYGKRKFHQKYNGHRIPFRDRSFDAVIFVDSLEHMAATSRMPLVRQSLKIARKKVVLLFPFGSPENIKFEKEYRGLLQEYGLPIKPSIREHYIFGLPDEKLIARAFKKYQPRIKYLSDRRIFGNYTFAQIIISAMLPNKAKTINTLLQEEMERKLINEKNVPRVLAHRAIIVIKK